VPAPACAFLAALAIAGPVFGAAAGETPAPLRVEARSEGLLAVALVRDDRMNIHLSRLIDNSPVRDAAVTVLLRGAAHPATAEADGGFTMQTKDLTLPGAAAVEFQVVQAGARETLKGTMQVAAGSGQPASENSARQLWWWVLNFAVCIGFLWLWSRRRKSARSKESV
jgi:hypothetical protein